MLQTPKGSRVHIGLFGKQNAGKSSLLNALVGQQASIVSNVAGTTTDPVDKAMELVPLGPVLFIDTAGIDDISEVGALRVEKTKQVFDRCDIALLVCVANEWSSYEQELIAEFKQREIPYILVLNKIDEYARVKEVSLEEAAQLAKERACEACVSTYSAENMPTFVAVSALTGFGIAALRTALVECVPEELINNRAIVSDVLPPHSTVMLVVPLDKAAPKGRLILPQVQVLRDLLDGGHQVMVVRDAELTSALEALKEPPVLVVTDSQVFKSVSEILPPEIPVTGFSVLMARHKGNLNVQVKGACAIENLTEESRVLIAEACTHHPIEQDIGTVKIPNFLRAKVGPDIRIDNVRGADFPADLASYDLVIHCGGCMFNRRTMLTRIQACLDAGVPVTNYGVVLAYFAGILDRAIEPLL